MEYVWASTRKGINATVDPTLVGQTIEALAAKHGAASPDLIVAKARPERSKLHPLFEWDDEKAAENWRIEQARAVVQCLRIVVGEEVEDAPAFVHVRVITDSGVSEGYRPTIEMQSDAEMAAYVKTEALAQLKAWKKRYGHLQAFAPIIHAIEEVERVSA